MKSFINLCSSPNTIRMNRSREIICAVSVTQMGETRYTHKILVGKSTSLTHSLIHSWNWALLEKLPIAQPLKKFPAFYGTRRFITAFTRALHWSLSWARSIQSLPSHPTSLRSILIVSTHLRLGLPSGLLPSGFPGKPKRNKTLGTLRSKRENNVRWNLKETGGKVVDWIHLVQNRTSDELF
jgi:hypothetical protein